MMTILLKKYISYAICLSQVLSAPLAWGERIQDERIHHRITADGMRGFHPLVKSANGYELHLDGLLSDIQTLSFYDEGTNEVLGSLNKTTEGVSVDWGASPLYLGLDPKAMHLGPISIKAQQQFTLLSSFLQHDTIIEAPTIRFAQNVVARHNLTLRATGELSLQDLIVANKLTLRSAPLNNHHTLAATELVLDSEAGHNHGLMRAARVSFQGNWTNHHHIQADHIAASGQAFIGAVGSLTTALLEFAVTVASYESYGVVRAFIQTIAEAQKVTFGNTHQFLGKHLRVKSDDGTFSERARFVLNGGGEIDLAKDYALNGTFVVDPQQLSPTFENLEEAVRSTYELEALALEDVFQKTKKTTHITQVLRVLSSGILTYNASLFLRFGSIFLRGTGVDLKGATHALQDTVALDQTVQATHSIRVSSAALLPRLFLSAPHKWVERLPEAMQLLQTNGGALYLSGDVVADYLRATEKTLISQGRVGAKRATLKINEQALLAGLAVQTLRLESEGDVYIDQLAVNEATFTSELGKVVLGSLEAPEAVVRALAQSVTILAGRAENLSVTATERDAYVGNMSARSMQIFAEQTAHVRNLTGDEAAAKGASVVASGALDVQRLTLESTSGDVTNTGHTTGKVVAKAAPGHNVHDYGRHDGDVTAVSDTSQHLLFQGSPRSVRTIVQRVFDLQNLIGNGHFSPIEYVRVVQRGDTAMCLYGTLQSTASRIDLVSKGDVRASDVHWTGPSRVRINARGLDLRRSTLQLDALDLRLTADLEAAHSTLEADEINVCSGSATLDFARWKAVRQDLNIAGHLSATAVHLLSKIKEGSALSPWLNVLARTLHGDVLVADEGDWAHSYQVLKDRPTFESDGPLFLLTREMFTLVAPIIKGANKVVFGSETGPADIQKVTLQDIRRWHVEFKKSGGFFGKSKKESRTETQTSQTVVVADISSGENLTTQAGPESTLTMHAPRVFSGGVWHIIGQHFNLLSALATNTTRTETQSSKGGWFGATKTGQVATQTQTEVVPPQIHVAGDVVIHTQQRAVLESLAGYIGGKLRTEAQETVVGAKAFGTHAEEHNTTKSNFSRIDYGWVFDRKDALPAMLDVGGIDILADGVFKLVGAKVHDHSGADLTLDPRIIYEEIERSESFQAYSKVTSKNQAALAVAVIAASFAGGMGGAALLEVAKGTIYYAMTAAGFSSAAGQVTSALMTGQSIEAGTFLKNLGMSMATSALGYQAVKWLELPTAQDWTGHLQHEATRAAARATVDITFGGRDAGDVAKSAFTDILVGTIGATFANKIGKAYANGEGTINYEQHKFLHALLGATMGAITDGKEGAISGAIAAPFAEIVMESMVDAKKEVEATQKENPEKSMKEVLTLFQDSLQGRKLMSRLMALTVGGLIGGSADVASHVAGSALDNNFEPMTMTVAGAAMIAITGGLIVNEAVEIYEKTGNVWDVLDYISLQAGIATLTAGIGNEAHHLGAIFHKCPQIMNAFVQLVKGTGHSLKGVVMEAAAYSRQMGSQMGPKVSQLSGSAKNAVTEFTQSARAAVMGESQAGTATLPKPAAQPKVMRDGDINLSRAGDITASTQPDTTRLLAPPSHTSYAGGYMRSFVTTKDEIYYRVFSDRPVGYFLTKVPPRSGAFAKEALSLPPSNTAQYVQEVLVPKGVRLQRSRASLWEARGS